MKIISVLVYPYEKSFVVTVTRAGGFFEYPQKKRTYSISYASDICESFFRWTQILQRLIEAKIFYEMQARSKCE